MIFSDMSKLKAELLTVTKSNVGILKTTHSLYEERYFHANLQRCVSCQP